MLAKPLLSHILANDALTRGLGDPEARVLVEWLVDQADQQDVTATDDEESRRSVLRLCRRGRALARFVCLWCYERGRRAALQLAATERFPWPLPTRSMDPCELMQCIVAWETEYAQAALQLQSSRTNRP